MTRQTSRRIRAGSSVVAAAVVLAAAVAACSDKGNAVPDSGTRDARARDGRIDSGRDKARPDTRIGADLAARPVVTIDKYPLVDGSTSTLPLARVIACELLGLSFKWEPGIGDEGTAEIVPVASSPAQQSLADAVMARIVHQKTHQAYLNLVDRVADLILVANPPSDEEAAYAALTPGPAGERLDSSDLYLAYREDAPTGPGPSRMDDGAWLLLLG